MPVLWSDPSLRNERCHPLFCKNETVSAKNSVDKNKRGSVAERCHSRLTIVKALQFVQQFFALDFQKYAMAAALSLGQKPDATIAYGPGTFSPQLAELAARLRRNGLDPKLFEGDEIESIATVSLSWMAEWFDEMRPLTR